MLKTMEVGETWTYPDRHWEWVSKIPESAALEWMKQSVPEALVAGFNAVKLDEVLQSFDKWGHSRWLNKLAVIVHNEGDGRVIALYKHDFNCWVLRYRG